MRRKKKKRSVPIWTVADVWSTRRVEWRQNNDPHQQQDAGDSSVNPPNCCAS